MDHSETRGAPNRPPAGEFASQAIASLHAAGVLSGSVPAVTPLGGGVSCEILLIEEGTRQMVVKRALEKLRVKAEWLADPGRNRSEQDYLRYAGVVVPGSVPRILHADPEANFFAMEYFGAGWSNWKSELLAGRIEPAAAIAAGHTLAAIHRASWGDEALRRRFATTANFFKLRLEPYLLTAGARNPPLEAYFQAEAARLADTSLALVHGDFSPKNILVSEDSARIVVLDCEVAWFGDPAFDLAFFLNHLLLKALHSPARKERHLGLGRVFLGSYRSELGAHWSDELERRVCRLTLLLLLARLDGKSPVEYLENQPEKHQILRDFVARELPATVAGFEGLAARWNVALPPT